LECYVAVESYSEIIARRYWLILNESCAPKNCHSSECQNCPDVGTNIWRGIAPMVEITETIGHIVIMGPVNIQFINLIVNILANFHVFSSRSTTLIFICRHIDSERLKTWETISGDQCLRSLPFNELDTLVVVPRTELSPVPPTNEKMYTNLSFYSEVKRALFNPHIKLSLKCKDIIIIIEQF